MKWRLLARRIFLDGVVEHPSHQFIVDESLHGRGCALDEGVDKEMPNNTLPNLDKRRHIVLR